MPPQLNDEMAAVKRLHDAANDPTYSSPRVRRADIQAVVRLVDAQAARLAAVEAARDKYQALWCETARMVHEERERATRLAALEQAARGWAHDGSHYAESALLDAIEALDAPPGESP